MKSQTALKTEVSFNSGHILMVIIVDYSPQKFGKKWGTIFEWYKLCMVHTVLNTM